MDMNIRLWLDMVCCSLIMFTICDHDMVDIFFWDSHWPLRITMFYQGSPTIVTMFFIYHLTYVGSCHDWSMPLTLMNLSVIWSGSGAPAVYGNSDVPNALWPNVQVPHLWSCSTSHGEKTVGWKCTLTAVQEHCHDHLGRLGSSALNAVATSAKCHCGRSGNACSCDWGAACCSSLCFEGQPQLSRIEKTESKQHR